MKSTGSYLLGIVTGVAAVIVYKSKPVQKWVAKAQDKYEDFKEKVRMKVQEQELKDEINELTDEIEDAVDGLNK